MGLPRFTYNGKTLDLPSVESILVQPYPPLRAQTWVTDPGKVQVLLYARMDIPVTVKWPQISEGTGENQWVGADRLRIDFENFYQWACHGNDFVFTLDSAKTVNTTLTADAAAGANTFAVASATGIANGVYRLISDNHYQIVTVTNVASLTVTIDETLNFDFLEGAFFRDRYYFPGKLRPDTPRYPIIDIRSGSQKRFEIQFAFHEAVWFEPEA